MSLVAEDRFKSRKRAVLRCISKVRDAPDDNWAKQYWQQTYRKLMEERRNEAKVLPRRSN